MVKDLRAHHLRRGMTPREVRSLLGPPSSVSPGLRGHRGVWWEWLTGDDGIDCTTVGARFLHGRLVETAEGQT
jgi:hypothetical protein